MVNAKRRVRVKSLRRTKGLNADVKVLLFEEAGERKKEGLQNTVAYELIALLRRNWLYLSDCMCFSQYGKFC